MVSLSHWCHMSASSCLSGIYLPFSCIYLPFKICLYLHTSFHQEHSQIVLHRGKKGHSLFFWGGKGSGPVASLESTDHQGDTNRG